MESTPNPAIQLAPYLAALSVALLVASPAVHASLVDDRLEQMVRENVENPWPDPVGTPDWGLPCYALAALHLNTNLPTANAYIHQWHEDFAPEDNDIIADNNDFRLDLFWRMYCDPAMNARLTSSARDNIEDLMWRWINHRSKLVDAGDIGSATGGAGYRVALTPAANAYSFSSTEQLSAAMVAAAFAPKGEVRKETVLRIRWGDRRFLYKYR